MNKISLSSLLGLLPVVGPVIAAAPQFKALWDEAVSTFAHPADQDTLKSAYDVAVSGADDAHQQLQELIAQHS